MVNEVYKNDNCNCIIESENKVNDFTLVFAFEEAYETKEFENV